MEDIISLLLNHFLHHLGGFSIIITSLLMKKVSPIKRRVEKAMKKKITFLQLWISSCFSNVK